MALVFAILFFSRELFESRFIALAAWGSSVVLVAASRLMIRGIQRSLRKFGIGTHRVLIIGNTSSAQTLLEEFSRKKRFPHIDKVIFSDQAKYLAKLPIDQNTFIIIVTHGHEFDYDCLKAVVRSNAAYIGVISSKLKRTKFLAQLKKEGVDQKYLKKIKIPVGIDIGAQTPEEIAISIAAEIISVTNKDSIGTAKFKRNP